MYIENCNAFYMVAFRRLPVGRHKELFTILIKIHAGCIFRAGMHYKTTYFGWTNGASIGIENITAIFICRRIEARK